jgi:hypothetical protein
MNWSLVWGNIPRIEPDAPENLETPEERETFTGKWVDRDRPCILIRQQ